MATRDDELMWKYRTLGGMMSPTERRRTQELIAMRNSPTEMQRFQADNMFRNSELETRRYEAEQRKEGMVGQGSTAAAHNAEAVKYKSDKDLEMGKYKVDRDKEIAEAQNATTIKVAGINADAKVDAQTEANKGIGIQGDWNVRLEQERAKTEAAKAAAQEQVWKNRQESKGTNTKERNRRIQQMVTNMQRMRKYKGKSIEELYETARRMIEEEQGNGE